MSDSGEFEDSRQDDEFDFDYVTGNRLKQPQNYTQGRQIDRTKLVANQHFDEALEVSDSNEESILTNPEFDNKRSKTAVALGDSPPIYASDNDDDKSEEDLGNNFMDPRMSSRGDAQRRPEQAPPTQDRYGSREYPDNEQDIYATQMAPEPQYEDYDTNTYADQQQYSDQQQIQPHHTQQQMQGNINQAPIPLPPDAYNPDDYKHLDVSKEIESLFEYIGRYEPQDIHLETTLQPFIPEYIPAVGEIDSFAKVPRPDGKNDYLGLKVVDEPASNQSDPTVLDLHLRYILKKSNVQPMKVRCIENAEENPQKVTTWINNIQEIHRRKPPPTVNYSKRMPDIERLMQVWPAEFEEMLRHTDLPSADIDMTLQEYAEVVCAMLDIPVYDNIVESLHVLCSLYVEFRQNQHFQQ